MLNQEERKYIYFKFLKNIQLIADKEYQRRVWIRGEGPECDDFDETCCRFFDDGDSVFQNYKDFWITNNQYEILKKFRDEFEVFADNNNWPQLFIDTPEWDAIVEMAKEVLRAFHYRQEATE